MLLITGGAGVMGQKLVRALALTYSHHKIRVLCLPGDAAADRLKNDAVEIVYGDITRPETLVSALKGVETVYHLAAVILAPGHPEIFLRVNVEGTRNLLEASMVAGVVHFIYVSSVSVLYPSLNAYARSKLAAEELVKNSGLPRFTIVRPALAYEDGGSAEFMHFVDYLRRGKVIFLPAGGEAKKNPVHIEDLVQGFLALLDNPRVDGKIYHFAGGEIVTLRQMAESLLLYMGKPKVVLSVPIWACRLGVAAMGVWTRLSGKPHLFTAQSLSGLLEDAVPNLHEAREDLGYRPRSFSQGLEELHSLRNCLNPRASVIASRTLAP